MLDLIFLDCNLPFRDGLSLLKTLKSDSRFQGIPVIIVTTEGERDNVVQAIQMGACDYLTKPFLREEIQEKLRCYLSCRMNESMKLNPKEEIENNYD